MKNQVSLPDIIKERKILPYEKKQNIMDNIFCNCLIFMIMLIITLIVNISFGKFSEKDFESYIDIIQIACGAISISVLEVAYRKNSGKIGIYGIEILIFSICVLFVPYMYISKLKLEFLKYTILLFFIYYFLKSVGILLHTRNSYLRKNISDVKEIVKEEKEGYIDEKSTKTLKEQKIENERKKKIKENKVKDSRAKDNKVKDVAKENKVRENEIKENGVKENKTKEIKIKNTREIKKNNSGGAKK